MNEKTRLLPKPTFFVFLIITIGVTLTTVQYLGRSSLTLDELASAKNIETRNYYQLATESLDFNQVAPIGFLFTQKAFISIFGTSDYAHRFLPWLASILSIFLFWQISRQFLTGVYLYSALLLFCSSVSLFFLGNMAKHYSGELAAVLFLVWAGLSFSPNKTQGWYWSIGMLGVLCALLSFPAAVMVPGVLALLYFKHKSERSALMNSYLPIAFLWLLGASLNLIFGKYAVADRQVFTLMHDYWQQKSGGTDGEGFPPSLNPLQLLAWIVKNTVELIGAFLFLAPPRPLFALSLTTFLCSLPGVVYAAKRKAFSTSVLLLPYLVGIALAVFEFYPWIHRVGRYSIWPFLILFPMGLMAVDQWLKRIVVSRITQVLSIALPAMVLLIVLVVGQPPIVWQPAEPVLKELKKAMEPSDIIYVYSKGRYAMERYGPKVGIDHWIAGNPYPQASAYKKDLNELKGKKRVWFFYTQWTQEQPFPDSIRVYLESMGKQLKVISKPEGKGGQQVAAAYLYDLSITK